MAFIELWCSNCNEMHDPETFHAGEADDQLYPGALLWVKRDVNVPVKRKKQKGRSPVTKFPWKLVSVVSKSGNIVTVKIDGVVKVLNTTSKIECLPYESRIVEDMTEMQHAHKPGILHNLKKRAFNKEPYTFVGNVLISINPLRQVPEPDIVTSDNEMDWSIPLPPHPRSVGEKAFRQMLFTATQRLRLINIDESKVRATVMAPSPDQLIDKESDFAKKYGLIHQTIVISGESGSGKTESAKRVLKQLLERELIGLNFDSDDEDDEDEQEFQDRLMGSTMLLESLGNATTKRNPNSSRFGSFLRLNYQPVYHDDSFSPGFYTYGASFTTYLLERSRVTEQSTGERNFNVFYQLLTSPNKNLQHFLGFTQAKKKFRYLGFRFEKTDEDRSGYTKLRTALRMTDLGVRNPFLFEVIAAILHLGNVDFEEEHKKGETRAKIVGFQDRTKERQSNIKERRARKIKPNPTTKKPKPSMKEMTVLVEEVAANERRLGLKKPESPKSVRPISGKLTKTSFMTSITVDSELMNSRLTKSDGPTAIYSPFRKTCKMLGLQQKDVAQILLRRVVKAGKETVVTYSTVVSAEKKRDALAKQVYAMLFDWVVYTINRGFNGQPDTDCLDDVCFIGILDIFGFENFRHNSLEQLLINYANEVMLALFVREVIIDESNLYRQEGLILKEDELEALSFKSETYGESIQLFEGIPGSRNMGILRVINGQRKVPDASDKKLLKSLNKCFSKQERYLRTHPSKLDKVFSIRHYASDVEYEVKGFLRKNDQNLPAELMGLFKGSRHKVVRQFPKVYTKKAKHYTLEALKATKMTKKQKFRKENVGASTTVCSVFQTQLKDLRSILMKTNCHYIRCVKPNPSLFIDHKRAFINDMAEESGMYIEPLEIVTRKFNAVRKATERRATMFGAKRKLSPKAYFEAEYVSEQLKNLGVYDCVNVLKCGLQTRIPYSAFTSIFTHHFPLRDIPFYRNRTIAFRERMFVGTLLKIFSQGSAIYKLGKTKVFFPAGELEQFQEVLTKATGTIRGKGKKRLKKHFVKAYATRIWRIGVKKIKTINLFTELMMRSRSASLIQRIARNYLFSKLFTARVVKRKGATEFQRLWRGYKVRLAVKEIRIRASLPDVDISTVGFTETSSTDFDDCSYEDIELTSDYDGDAFRDNMKTYFDKKTRYNRRTNALSTFAGTIHKERLTTYRNTVATRVGTIYDATYNDDAWNDIELSLFELDGDKADPELDPFNEPKSDIEEDVKDILTVDDIKQAKNDKLKPKRNQNKGQLPMTHDVRVTLNKMNPRHKKKGRKTVTFPEWRNVQLRPVSQKKKRKPLKKKESAQDVRERARNVWGAVLRRVRD